jgi:small conductance mechanosensitive channel
MSDRLHEFYASLDTRALTDAVLAWSGRLLIALLILLIGWWLARRIAGGVQGVLTRGGADPLLGSFLRNLVFVLLLALVVVGALDRAGVPTASLLAALGAAGLAIGLALQGSLSNLAAGVLLMAFRPFRVGDSIEVGSVAGVVQNVSLMQTFLLTADNREVILPNSKVTSDVIVNVNARGTRRVDLAIGIAHDADVGKALELLRAIGAADTRVLAQPAVEVAVLQLTESGVQLALRSWTRAGDFGGVQSDLLRTIKQRFDAEGINLARPLRDIVLREVLPVEPH